MKLLVTGGAGYIGSHFCATAAHAGHQIYVLDNLSTGHRESVARFPFFIGDTRDSAFVENILKTNGIQTVVHFAGLSIVSESIRQSENYFDNNLEGTHSVLNAMRKAGARQIAFSSSAAVYGSGRGQPLTESDPKQPINPYGESKLRSEELIRKYVNDHHLHAGILRYFNVIGQHPTENIFEKHEPETHLVPNILRAAHEPREFSVFGNDFPTPDGTCIRDYVDVNDLAAVHLAALKYIENERLLISNVGTGKGNSVLQMLRACQEVLGVQPEVRIRGRREGDPASLVADSTFFSSWYKTKLRSVPESLKNLKLSNSFD